MKNYDICYSLDNAYFEQLATSIASILKNSSDEESFHFYILHSGVDKKNIEKIALLKKIKNFEIDYIKLEEKDFEICPLLNKTSEEFAHYHVTLPTYYRFKLASVLNNLDKIIYLDCDIVITGSLEELWNIDLNDNYAGMIEDVETENESERLNISNYYNAGVILANLKKWREDDIENKLFSAAIKFKDIILWQDQDIINLVFNNKIKKLPRKWNFQYFLYDENRYNGLFDNLYKYNIIHFAGRFKPWENKASHPLFQEYYKYLALTPWQNRIAEVKFSRFEKLIEEKREQLVHYVDIFKNDMFLLIEDKLKNIQENNSVDINKNFSYIDKKLAEEKSFIEEKTQVLKQEILQQADNSMVDKENRLYKEISKNYDYTNSEITNKMNLCEEKFIYSKELIENISKDVNDKESRLYDELSKLYSSVNERIKQTEIKQNGKYEQAIKTTELNLLQQKEVINRLIDNKTENLQNFFENAIKTQLDLLKNLYENEKDRINKTNSNNLENQKIYYENLIVSKQENQKQWYENQLQNQKNWYEEEIQRRLREKDDWHIANYKSVVSEKDLLIKNNDDKYNQLQQDFNNTNNQVSELIQKNQELLIQIEDFKNQKEELLVKLEESNCQNEDDAIQIEELKCQNKDLFDKINAKEQQLEEKTSNLQNSEKYNNELIKQNEELQNQVTERNGWLDYNVSQMQELNNKIKKAEDQLRISNSLLKEKDVQIQNQQIQFEKRIKPIKPIVNAVDKLRTINRNIKKKYKK